MIAMLRGILAEKLPEQVLIDVGGVGYRVFIALSTYDKLPDPGQEVRILTITSVREDALHLYGFATPEEKIFFTLLNTVNGISARLALSALSTLSVPTLVAAIGAEDLTTLCRIPGVGRRTAQRMVVELKDRLPVGVQLSPEPHHATGTNGTPSPGSGERPSNRVAAPLREEISLALLNLGYKRTEVEWALHQILSESRQTDVHPGEAITTVSNGVRAALKMLARPVGTSTTPA